LNRQAPQESFNFRTPNFSLGTISSFHALDGRSQTQNQVTGWNFNRHQAKRVTSLTLYRITQGRGPRQPFGHYQAKPCFAIRTAPTIVQIKTLTAHHPPGRHNGGKLLRPMQTLI